MGLESGGTCYTLDSGDKHLCLLVFGKKNKKELERLVQLGLNDQGIEIQTRPQAFWQIVRTGLIGTENYELHIVGQQ